MQSLCMHFMLSDNKICINKTFAINLTHSYLHKLDNKGTVELLSELLISNSCFVCNKGAHLEPVHQYVAKFKDFQKRNLYFILICFTYSI